MRKSALISLTTLALLLAIVVVATLLSPKKAGRDALDGSHPAKTAQEASERPSSSAGAASSQSK